MERDSKRGDVQIWLLAFCALAARSSALNIRSPRQAISNRLGINAVNAILRRQRPEVHVSDAKVGGKKEIKVSTVLEARAEAREQ